MSLLSRRRKLETLAWLGWYYAELETFVNVAGNPANIGSGGLYQSALANGVSGAYITPSVFPVFYA